MFCFPSRSGPRWRWRDKLDNGDGFDALKVRIRLPNGQIYQQTGKLDFVNNSVTGNSDTLQLRAVIPNPASAPKRPGPEHATRPA